MMGLHYYNKRDRRNEYPVLRWVNINTKTVIKSLNLSSETKWFRPTAMTVYPSGMFAIIMDVREW